MPPLPHAFPTRCVRLPAGTGISGGSVNICNTACRLNSRDARTENFNPDFLLKLAGRDIVLVVEIKSDDDDSARNKAKLRDAKEHFAKLNAKLAATDLPREYHFHFLSATDYGHFFEAIRDDRLAFKSSLMIQLGGE